MHGKNVEEMAEILFPRAANLVLTQPENSRAMSPEQIRSRLPNSLLNAEPVLIPSVEAALKAARELSGDEGRR